MARQPTRGAVLSLQRVAMVRQNMSAVPAYLDLELARGQVAFIEVADEDEARLLIDLCLGVSDPDSGQAFFLGTSWQTLNYPDRLSRRRRVGSVVQTDVWPAHLSVFDAVMLSRFFHADHPPEEAIADATRLARLFGLPGLPAGRREATQPRSLVRAGCVRGFLGTPELVVIQDHTIEDMADLAEAMAQAVGLAQDRGAAVLWVVGSLQAAAIQFVQADHVLRLADHGLVPVRRLR